MHVKIIMRLETRRENSMIIPSYTANVNSKAISNQAAGINQLLSSYTAATASGVLI